MLYAYDAKGRVHTRQWARGVVTTYSYDLRNRVIGTSYSDSTPGVSLTYDGLGRLVLASKGALGHLFEHYPDHTYESVTLPGNASAMIYSYKGAGGNRASISATLEDSVGTIQAGVGQSDQFDSGTGQLTGSSLSDFGETLSQQLLGKATFARTPGTEYISTVTGTNHDVANAGAQTGPSLLTQYPGTGLPG